MLHAGARNIASYIENITSDLAADKKIYTLGNDTLEGKDFAYWEIALQDKSVEFVSALITELLTYAENQNPCSSITITPTHTLVKFNSDK